MDAHTPSKPSLSRRDLLKWGSAGLAAAAAAPVVWSPAHAQSPKRGGTLSLLSFLGLGVPPPQPSWGAMLAGSGRSYMQRAPWMAIFPGLAISLAVFGFNMLGDALRDVLDPRLRGTGIGPGR